MPYITKTTCVIGMLTACLASMTEILQTIFFKFYNYSLYE